MERVHSGSLAADGTALVWWNRKTKIALALVLVFYLGPPSFIALDLAWEHTTGIDRHLDRPYHSISPDGKTLFTASIDGVAQMIDVPSHRTLMTRHIDTVNHRFVSGIWQDNRHIGVTELLRHPFKMNADYYIWDRNSANITKP